MRKYLGYIIPFVLLIITWMTFVTINVFDIKSNISLIWQETNRQKDSLQRIENNINGLLLNVTIDKINRR